MKSSSSPPKVTALVRSLTNTSATRLIEFRALPLETQSAVFERLSPHVQQQLLEKLRTEELLQLLDHFDLQQTENILARLRNPKKRQRLVARLQRDLKEKAEYFLRFHPKAELNLLHFNYVLAPATASVQTVAKLVREHYEEVGRRPEVLVHDGGVFVGEIPPHDLIEATVRTRVRSLLASVPTIFYQAPLAEVVGLFEKTHHGKVVVLDTDGSVVGIIYADDALRLFGHAPAAALYDFAGVADAERALDPWWRKVRYRYIWLIVNLATAFLAASVVSLFEATLEELVLLAMYMPIIAGMGGNAGAQALAITVRGITVGEVSLRSGLRPISQEMLAGLVNGLLIGLLVMVIAMIWNGSPLFGLVVGVSMVLNLIVAGFFGALIPLVMKSLGRDPATSATVFITTATDVFGFFIFLGLATLVLL